MENVSYEGIGYLSVTFPASTCLEGKLCKLNQEGWGETCKDGDSFLGLVESVKNGRTAVQIAGFVEIGYTGTAPAVGFSRISANGKGGVKADSAGREYLVVACDTTKSTIIMKL